MANREMRSSLKRWISAVAWFLRACGRGLWLALRVWMGWGRCVGGRAWTWKLNLARLVRLGAAFRASSLFCLRAWGRLGFASVRAWGLRGGGGPP